MLSDNIPRIQNKSFGQYICLQQRFQSKESRIETNVNHENLIQCSHGSLHWLQYYTYPKNLLFFFYKIKCKIAEPAHISNGNFGNGKYIYSFSIKCLRWKYFLWENKILLLLLHIDRHSTIIYVYCTLHSRNRGSNKINGPKSLFFGKFNFKSSLLTSSRYKCSKFYKTQSCVNPP